MALSIHTPDAPRGVSNVAAFLTMRQTAAWLVHVALIFARMALSVHTRWTLPEGQEMRSHSSRCDVPRHVYVALIIVRVALSVHTPDAPRGVSNVAAFLTLRHTAT